MEANNSSDKKPEKFVCIACAFFWTTTDYSDEEPFRYKFNKIWAKCPRCGVTSYKPIEIRNND